MTATKMNAPATPMVTAFNIDGILTPLAIPKTIIPANRDARDLWSLRTGTESKTPLIRGKMKGAINDADRTAIIASSKTTPLTFLNRLEDTL